MHPPVLYALRWREQAGAGAALHPRGKEISQKLVDGPAGGGKRHAQGGQGAGKNWGPVETGAKRCDAMVFMWLRCDSEKGV